MKKNILSMAALLMASATVFTACSNADNIIDEQPVNPTEQKVYTMTVQATKGDNAAQTRGLALDGKTLNVKWNEGETVEVMMTDNAFIGTYTSIGTLTAAASETGETTLTGTVSGLTEGKTLRFFLRGHEMDYTGQKGVLLSSDDAENSIETKYDYAATDEVTTYSVSGSTVTVSGGITLKSQQAIVKFTLKDQSGNAINATSLTIKENTGANGFICQSSDATITGGSTTVIGSLTITPAAATSTIYAAIYDFHNATSATSSYTLEATDADGNIYAYTKDGILFATGKYYEVTVKMHEFVNLGLSVKWATTNVGADTETAYGTYFAWAATTANTTYNWLNTPYYGGNISTWSRYSESKAVLETADDAAAANWRGGCRMPTLEEWQELVNNCDLTWQADYNGSGIKGVLVTSRKEGYTTKSIFLPAAGDRCDQGDSQSAGPGLEYENVRVSCWSSTLSEDPGGYSEKETARPFRGFAYHIYMFKSSYSDAVVGIDGNKINYSWRCMGMPVRPVLP